MHVIIVSHDTFWPLRGGGGIRVYWVTKAFIKRKYRVSVIAPVLTYDGFEKEFGQIEMMSIGRLSRFIRFKEAIYLYMMIRMFIKLLFKKYDLIYAQNAVAGLPSILISKLKGVPLIYDMHDLLTGYSRNWFIYHLGMIMEKYIARQSKITVVTSKSAKKWCSRSGIDHTVIVANGVDVEHFRPIKQKRKYITFTGGMEVNDGMQLIPLAAQKIVKTYPDSFFMLVGEGKGVNQLIQLVKDLHLMDHFVFRGWIDHFEIPKVLSQSKVGLITSLKGPATDFSSPLRSYEYMASELPFVASNLDGTLEQVEESQAGVIFESGNAEDLARAVIKLLGDERLCRSLGRNGRRYVTRFCNWAQNMEKICDVSETLV